MVKGRLGRKMRSRERESWRVGTSNIDGRVVRNQTTKGLLQYTEESGLFPADDGKALE